MKKIFLLAALSLTFCKYSDGQIICILCYVQNDSISSGVTNLLLNGGFENTNCTPSTGVIGSPTSICPNSTGYSCDFANWTCTGGGSETYACLYNTSVNKSMIDEGNNAVYFGNFYANACSPITDDISCLINLDCTITGIPAGYPENPDIAFGGATGVSLQQTVNGLIPGNTYVLEFWAGGEEYYAYRGLFALDVGFGDTLLSCKSTAPGDTGIVYIVEFNATSPSQTIKFTNWGHICGSCTELVLDNVRLYTLAQLSASVPSCGGSVSSANFAASNTIICEKFCVNYYDSSANNPTAWQWQFPGGAPSSSTLENPLNICYNTPGTYDVTLITTSASGNDTLTLHNYITVNPTPPMPTITQVGYTLTSSPASFYQWQFNTVDIPGATNQSYTVTQTGYYSVVVSDTNSCQNSFTQYVLISGIDDVYSNAAISISPNPSSGSFTIEWLNAPDLAGMADEVSIDIVNTLGQKVFSSAEKISGHEWKKAIDLHHAAKGVYYIEIKTQNEFVRKKMVIQ